jgi:hypothetical protein
MADDRSHGSLDPAVFMNPAAAKPRDYLSYSDKLPQIGPFLPKLLILVGAAGLEPATLSLEDSVSIDYREHMGLRRCILAIETIENTTPDSF